MKKLFLISQMHKAKEIFFFFNTYFCISILTQKNFYFIQKTLIKTSIYF